MFPAMLRLLLLTGVVALLVPALARGQAPAHDVTLTAPAGVVYGSSVDANGTVTPVEAGLTVTLEQKVAGVWTSVTTATTDAAGAYSTTFLPATSGPLRARLGGGELSPERSLKVFPAAALGFGKARAFLGVRLHVGVQPGTYAERARISVRGGRRLLARTTARVLSGTLIKRVPTPWAGRVVVRIVLPGGDGLAARTIRRRVWVSARTLRTGSRGPDVRALHRRLAHLHIHVPSTGTYFSVRSYDSVIAFQKARGLPRTGVVGTTTWRALGLVRAFQPRYSRPTPHIEVDKSRQILMVVRRGVVTGLIPISSGATGNTPVGAWNILWKAPATGTWLGSATLYRTMTFHGNFAIHGYYSVPPYPASHGCVRVPIWEADWLYNQSPVGERVYVYE
jgi:N-acetylmuramoyl-L-alanine amidase